MEMENNNKQAYNFNSGNLFMFFYRWRKPLVIISAVAAVVSAIISLTLPNKYKSVVVMFPSTTNSISKAMIAENRGTKDDVLKFGEEEEAEQLLQILNSDEIRNRIIEKYNLMSHYEIEEDDEFKYTKLQRAYESNVNFRRTKFMSVEVEVLDENPDTAALIANDIAALLDTVKNRMIKEIAVKAFQIVEAEFLNHQGYIQALEDSLTKLRALGVSDYESQVERITEQMATAILMGKASATKELQEKLDVLNKYGGAYVSIRDQLEYEKKQLTFLRTKYQEAKIDAESILEHKFIVNHAFPAEKKSYPIRWLIVVASTISSFLITLLLVLFVESMKSARDKLNS